MSENIKAPPIPGLSVINPDVFRDHRGEYVETWNEKGYEYLIPGIRFVQDDISVSKKGVLRGLHGDRETHKLIQCLYGSLVLVVLDMREGSPTHLKWLSFDLTSKNRKQVLVPAGCANGHLCLSEECIFSYKQTTYYTPGKQFSIRCDSFGIEWPIARKKVILSDRDLNADYYKSAEDYHKKHSPPNQSVDMGGAC